MSLWGLWQCSAPVAAIDKLTRKQLERAAELRWDLTWEQLRDRMNLGTIRSTDFYKAWAREGIPHKPKRQYNVPHTPKKRR